MRDYLILSAVAAVFVAEDVTVVVFVVVTEADAVVVIVAALNAAICFSSNLKKIVSAFKTVLEYAFQILSN